MGLFRSTISNNLCFLFAYKHHYICTYLCYWLYGKKMGNYYAIMFLFSWMFESHSWAESRTQND